MEEFSEESKNQIKLSKEKKEAIRVNVMAFVRKNPLKSGREFKIYEVFSAFGFGGSANATAYMPRASFALVAVVLFGSIAFGATSFAAEYSLPGDILYPVKTGFNEKVMGVLAFSDKAKIKLDTVLAMRRLYEAEQLIIKNKLNSQNQVAISQSLQNNSKNASLLIAKLKNNNQNDTAELSLNLRASLDAHSRILEQIKPKENNNAADNLITDVQKSVLDVQQSQNNSDDISNQKELAANEINNAKKEIDSVKKLIEGKKDKIGGALPQTQENLNIAEEKLQQAQEKISEPPKSATAPDYKAAEDLANNASLIAKESKTLINAADNLGVKIDLRINENNGLKDNKNNSNDINKQDNVENNVNIQVIH